MTFLLQKVHTTVTHNTYYTITYGSLSFVKTKFKDFSRTFWLYVVACKTAYLQCFNTTDWASARAPGLWKYSLQWRIIGYSKKSLENCVNSCICVCI